MTSALIRERQWKGSRGKGCAAFASSRKVRAHVARHPGYAHQMWAAGAKKNLAMCPLVGPDALASIDRMCAKYPDTPVVIDHMARIGGDGEIRDSDVKILCSLAQHANVKVKLSAFYASAVNTPLTPTSLR